MRENHFIRIVLGVTDTICTMRISRAILYAMTLVSILLVLFTVPGEKGLIRSYQLHQELEDLQVQNSDIRKKNQVLAQEALMLRENLAYIEHVIIQEMNLVKPGDMIVVFKKAKK